MDLWYDEMGAGDGPPVVLLHGGMCTADSWVMQSGTFAETRRVYRPEQRGHGHTPDPGEVSYDLMAADTIEFLESVVGGPADLVGWSDGGIVGLLVAIARPDLVRKLVTIGANFHYDGTLLQFFDGLNDDEHDPLRAPYAAVSPDGDAHWPIIKKKLMHMWRTEPTLNVTDIAQIQAPTLVLVADDDAAHFGHVIDLYTALPQGQLAVIPGASHLVPLEKPALVNQLILDFLDDGSVVSFLPMRRAGVQT